MDKADFVIGFEDTSSTISDEELKEIIEEMKRLQEAGVMEFEIINIE
jgi:hypothetical protein